MFEHQSVSELRRPLDEGLITEATRCVLKLPQFAGVDPAMVRELVESEVDRGNITLYGVLRSDFHFKS